MIIKPKKKKPGNTPGSNYEISTNYETPTNIDDFLFDANKQLPDEQVIIRIQDKLIGSVGNAVVITGKPKSRKSVVAHSIICSAISGKNVLGIESNLPADDDQVCLIDTEQSNHDLAKSLNRMKQLGEIEKFDDKLLVYTFRSLGADQIKKSINSILNSNPKIRLLIIDGGLDLLNNMNDILEVKETIDFLKQLFSKHQVCVVMVIHQSKSTGFTIGHWGSFMDRFGQTNIEVSKLDNGNSQIKSQHMRSDADFQTYEFYFNYNINNYSLHWSDASNQLNNTSGVQPGDISIGDHQDKLDLIFSHKNGSITYKELINQIQKVYEKNSTWAKKCVVHFYDQNLIEKTLTGILQILPKSPF
jgi:hypothetical protein